MPYKCCVVNCCTKDLMLHVFPKDLEMCKKWCVAIGREELMSKIPTVQKHYRVCDVHFDEQSKFPFNRNRTNLKVGSIPCLHLPAPKKIAAWLLKRQLPSNPDDRGTTRKTITLCITLENWIGRIYHIYF
jgi:hypothetical protein